MTHQTYLHNDETMKYANTVDPAEKFWQEAFADAYKKRSLSKISLYEMPYSIDDKGYQEGTLENYDKMVASRGQIGYDKMSDGCCHKTVTVRCADCSFNLKSAP